MNLKKIINKEIPSYTNKSYSEVFYQILKDLEYDFSHNKVKKIKKLLDIKLTKDYNNNWSKLTQSIDDLDDDYNLPKIVVNYLKKLANEKLIQILKFCKKEKVERKDVIKMVNLILIFYFIILLFLKFIENSNQYIARKIMMMTKTKLKINFNKSLSKVKNNFNHIYNANPISSIKIPINKTHLVMSKILRDSIQKEMNDEDEAEDLEKKKKEVMKDHSNIYIGNFHKTDDKSNIVKVFEGKYCNTFLVVDNSNPQNKNKKVNKDLKLSTFSQSSRYLKKESISYIDKSINGNFNFFKSNSLLDLTSNNIDRKKSQKLDENKIINNNNSYLNNSSIKNSFLDYSIDYKKMLQFYNEKNRISKSTIKNKTKNKNNSVSTLIPDTTKFLCQLEDKFGLKLPGIKSKKLCKYLI